MTQTQKYAVFTLTVAVGTVVVVAALYPVLGPRAFGGLGLLGFWGFSGLFFRRSADGGVLFDERDGLIWVRSVVIAFSVFWMMFVLAATALAPFYYGWDGAVPVAVISLAVAGGMIVVMVVQSVAMLAQYAGGAGHVGDRA